MPAAGNQMREQRGDVASLQKVDEAHQHGVDFIKRATRKSRQRIDDHHRRILLEHLAVHRRQVKLESVQSGTRRMNLEQALAYPVFQMKTGRSHVAEVLRGRFFELE